MGAGSPEAPATGKQLLHSSTQHVHPEKNGDKTAPLGALITQDQFEPLGSQNGVHCHPSFAHTLHMPLYVQTNCMRKQMCTEHI